jgi:hypothetical protein
VHRTFLAVNADKKKLAKCLALFEEWHEGENLTLRTTGQNSYSKTESQGVIAPPAGRQAEQSNLCPKTEIASSLRSSE